MTARLTDLAARLAARAYRTEYKTEPTIDRRKQVIVALNPELPGCMAQGDTREEALMALNEARVDFIASLLEAGISVPEPGPSSATAQAKA